MYGAAFVHRLNMKNLEVAYREAMLFENAQPEDEDGRLAKVCSETALGTNEKKDLVTYRRKV